MAKISSISELVNVMSNAKCGGQFVTLYIEKPISMNAFPTDGSEKVRRDKSFVAMDSYAVQFNFSADYDRAMSKAMGADYKAHDSNRRHLVHNVLVEYQSTGNVCMIYMPKKYLYRVMVGADGKELSACELAYVERYKTKSNSGAVIDYRTISVKYIKRIAIGNTTYELEIGK